MQSQQTHDSLNAEAPASNQKPFSAPVLPALMSRFAYLKLISAALFWAWCLIWVSNAGNASWPVKVPETLGAVRLAWFAGQSLLAAGLRWSVQRASFDRRLLIAFGAPVAVAGSLGVVLIPSGQTSDVALLAIASTLAGIGSVGLLPLWDASFTHGRAARLSLMVSISALGAVTVFQACALLDYRAASVVFVLLPLLSSVAAWLGCDKDGERQCMAPVVVADTIQNRTLDIGHTAFALLAGFTMGLDVLSYQTIDRRSITIVLALSSMVVAVLLAGWLAIELKKPHASLGYQAVLPLAVVGLLALPYLGANASTQMEIAIAAIFLCWAMLYTLAQSATVYHLRVAGLRFTIPARIADSMAGLIAALAGLWLSRTLDLADEFRSSLLLVCAYILIAAATLFISTRVASIGATSTSATSEPQPDVIAYIAKKYGLTPRETEIIAILGAGRSHAFVQKKLSIAPGTATTHIAHIHQKLCVHNREELIDLLEKEREICANSR